MTPAIKAALEKMKERRKGARAPLLDAEAIRERRERDQSAYDNAIEAYTKRFHSYYKIAQSGCWEWFGPKRGTGYGAMGLFSSSGRKPID